MLPFYVEAQVLYE